jgi:hypothetical protein
VLQFFDAVFAAIPTCEGHIRWICHPFRRMITLYFSRVHPTHMPMSQAVKDVSTGYGALVHLLESIEQFMNRLNIYTRLPSTEAMIEMIVKIMVELVSMLALMTKQIKQKRPSEFVAFYILLV